MKLKAMADLLLKSIYPAKCPFCGTALPAGAYCCDDCKSQLHPAMQRRRYRLADGQILDCYAVYTYEGAMREAIHRFKFQDCRDIGPTLSQLALAEEMVRSLLQRVDVITAVPISKNRRRERGYNQSELLARPFQEYSGVPYAALLQKVIDTPSQSSLDRQGRLQSVIGAYGPAKGADSTGKRVLLVDDIVTTGATLCACTKVLYAMGAASVVAVTVCHADFS
ncbi:MAG: ComF family protein [Oscillospiraceae bacterium]|nr:ComF family protein [Oscillospiraceae bacterium]